MIVTAGLMIGLLLILIAIIALIVIAYKSDVIWGLLSLLLVPLPLFVILHPVKSRYAVALFLIGATTTGFSLWGGADQALGLKAKAESMGISDLPGFDRLRAPVVAEVVIELDETDEAASEEAAPAEPQTETKSPVVRRSEPRFMTVSAAEVEAFTGSLFRGKTYDGRLIQGTITNATGATVTLARKVSQGSATFDYNLTMFELIMVARP